MSRLKIGDKIVWTADLCDGNSLKSGIVTKVGMMGAEPTVWVDAHHKQEDCLYAFYCWPEEVKEELKAILEKRKALKKAFDDSMGLVYELRNQLARGS